MRMRTGTLATLELSLHIHMCYEAHTLAVTRKALMARRKSSRRTMRSLSGRRVGAQDMGQSDAHKSGLRHFGRKLNSSESLHCVSRWDTTKSSSYFEYLSSLSYGGKLSIFIIALFQVQMLKPQYPVSSRAEVYHPVSSLQSLPINLHILDICSALENPQPETLLVS